MCSPGTSLLNVFRDFPGCPAVRTLLSKKGGTGSSSGQGTKIEHATGSGGKKKTFNVNLNSYQISNLNLFTALVSLPPACHLKYLYMSLFQ